ncbi:MAG: hypothetical protein J5501_06475 [Ruminococcus sp.]|nr:hypothetical protein [Ruminococcus sp.]
MGKKKKQSYELDKNVILFAIGSVLLAVLTGLVMPFITEKTAARAYRKSSADSLR